MHSDQGSVYSSKKYNELLPMYGITRSMSRAGTSTDNAAMEAINGWIKAELFVDLHVTSDRPVAHEVDEYVIFFNEQRPAYSLNYLTPKQYREKYTCAQFHQLAGYCCGSLCPAFVDKCSPSYGEYFIRYDVYRGCGAVFCQKARICRRFQPWT